MGITKIKFSITYLMYTLKFQYTRNKPLHLSYHICSKESYMSIFAATKPVRSISSIRKTRLQEKRRAKNRSRKSTVATHIKKAMNILTLKASDVSVKTEDDVDEKISKAFSEIDKAVQKGVIHRRTGNRRKSRIAKHKKRFLMQKGLYTPVSQMNR